MAQARFWSFDFLAGLIFTGGLLADDQTQLNLRSEN
jgi:hypothetical protein